MCLMVRGGSLLAYVCQVSFRSDISFLRYRAETKQVSNFCSIFRSCDLDLCPTSLNINRLPPLAIINIEQKFEAFFVSARYLKNKM
jgi:hypothetical protein